jgi:small subunit ribosomal protein S7
MAKKFESTERFLMPDPRYSDKILAKFINCVMRKGKKALSERIVYEALDIIGKRVKDQEPLGVFHAAINNVKPLLEVRSKRVGGATYQVPVEVKKKRQLSLAIRWILTATRGKKGKPMQEKLADELVDAYNKQGAAMTVRENTHKMAEANKAFAHFAW